MERGTILNKHLDVGMHIVCLHSHVVVTMDLEVDLIKPRKKVGNHHLRNYTVSV